MVRKRKRPPVWVFYVEDTDRWEDKTYTKRSRYAIHIWTCDIDPRVPRSQVAGVIGKIHGGRFRLLRLPDRRRLYRVRRKALTHSEQIALVPLMVYEQLVAELHLWASVHAAAFQENEAMAFEFVGICQAEIDRRDKEELRKQLMAKPKR